MQTLVWLTKLNKPEDIDHAVIESTSTRVRPLVMTVATTVLGLMPLLWESGLCGCVCKNCCTGYRWSLVGYAIDIVSPSGSLYDLEEETVCE